MLYIHIETGDVHCRMLYVHIESSGRPQMRVVLGENTDLENFSRALKSEIRLY